MAGECLYFIKVSQSYFSLNFVSANTPRFAKTGPVFEVIKVNLLHPFQIRLLPVIWFWLVCKIRGIFGDVCSHWQLVPYLYNICCVFI